MAKLLTVVNRVPSASQRTRSQNSVRHMREMLNVLEHSVPLDGEKAVEVKVYRSVLLDFGHRGATNPVTGVSQPASQSESRTGRFSRGTSVQESRRNGFSWFAGKTVGSSPERLRSRTQEENENTSQYRNNTRLRWNRSEQGREWNRKEQNPETGTEPNRAGMDQNTGEQRNETEHGNRSRTESNTGAEHWKREKSRK